MSHRAESIVILVGIVAVTVALVAPVWRDLRRAWKNHRP